MLEIKGKYATAKIFAEIVDEGAVAQIQTLCENMDSEKLIDFMGRLIRDVRKKVFLILDNLRVHHSKKGSGKAGRL